MMKQFFDASSEINTSPNVMFTISRNNGPPALAGIISRGLQPASALLRRLKPALHNAS